MLDTYSIDQSSYPTHLHNTETETTLNYADLNSLFSEKRQDSEYLYLPA